MRYLPQLIPLPLAPSALDASRLHQNIIEPHQNDVLCGRGGLSNNHVGNVAWRKMVADNQEKYLSLSKRDKSYLSRRIVDSIRSQDPPGRFLKKDNKTGLWCDIGDKDAQRKTSQALREGAPERRKNLPEDVKSILPEAKKSNPDVEKSNADVQDSKTEAQTSKPEPGKSNADVKEKEEEMKPVTPEKAEVEKQTEESSSAIPVAVSAPVPIPILSKRTEYSEEKQEMEEEKQEEKEEEKTGATEVSQHLIEKIQREQQIRLQQQSLRNVYARQQSWGSVLASTMGEEKSEEKEEMDDYEDRREYFNREQSWGSVLLSSSWGSVKSSMQEAILADSSHKSTSGMSAQDINLEDISVGVGSMSITRHSAELTLEDISVGMGSMSITGHSAGRSIGRQFSFSVKSIGSRSSRAMTFKSQSSRSIASKDLSMSCGSLAYYDDKREKSPANNKANAGDMPPLVSCLPDDDSGEDDESIGISFDDDESVTSLGSSMSVFGNSNIEFNEQSFSSMLIVDRCPMPHIHM